MNFITFDEFEVITPLKGIFGEPGDQHQYRAVVVNLNISFFLIEYIIPSNEANGGMLETIMFSSADDVLQFINQNKTYNIDVYLLSRRYENINGENNLCLLSEILIGKYHDEQLIHVYRCKNGKQYFENGEDILIDDLSDLKLLYKT